MNKLNNSATGLSTLRVFEVNIIHGITLAAEGFDWVAASLS